ncbi:ABC transporter permease [Mycobacterium persicum]|uniref:ABC transporter permease n=1 Tax=Mycobacterium persicum TaxID=1487726 RepID=A0A1X0L9N6_9MYCO|nr:ABC transporter permease [Mycobacterium persicum]KZS82206.1 ABC transporter permease [Mycobacterium persicum]ORB47285.1 ABC transporter permease [Mycobacterium persicum]ORB90305.1 ABC transporter permease [Mycobacterium persicum]ORB95721.1 ABC transporter permease [Mycobacterium persicum]ORC02485.1 ABC transporter permease [Mycobacterium persicum]
MIIAVKNLVVERARLVFSVLGVGIAVLLVLVISGIFVGTTNQVTTYIDHSKGAVWVVQPGVEQLFRAVSWLPAEDRNRLLTVPGVQSADPILGQPSDFVHNGTQTAYFVVGYDTLTGVGGPWSLAQGRNVARSGEVVLDRVLATKNGIKLGDKVQIVDEDFTVVGLSNQTAALGNFYAFISLPDAARLLRAGNRVSYFLVQPRDGYTATQLAAAIHRDLPDMDALAAATFTDNSRAIIISMIGRPLKTMIAIAVLVGVALVGLTVLAVTNEQLRDFGVLRALGVRPIQLCRTVLAQAAVIAGLGYLAGAAVAYGAQFLIADRLGDVTVEITPTLLAVMAAATAVMAVLGSLIPVRRVVRIDPVTAFRR